MYKVYKEDAHAGAKSAPQHWVSHSASQQRKLVACTGNAAMGPWRPLKRARACASGRKAHLDAAPCTAVKLAPFRFTLASSPCLRLQVRRGVENTVPLLHDYR